MNTRSTSAAGGRAVRRLGDHLLTLLAVGGALCILLVIFSWAFSISIMMFRTGSMSPTITAGSIAFVREIPAVEMEEGDIVTVGRGEGVLPVTHRVIEIQEQGPATGEVTFVMRGDANEAEDPEPYTATEVQRVMFAVPGAAKVVQLFGDPRVLGGLTIGATLLVVWAFWPRRGDRSDDDQDPSGEGAEAEGRGEETVSDSAPREAPTRQALTLPVLATLVLAAPAVGGTETTLITGEHLRLQTEGDPAQMQNLTPGRPVVWEVGVWAEAPDPGEIRLGITGRGELAEIDGALSVSVEGCSTEWVDDRCETGAVELLDAESLDSLAEAGQTRLLTTMPSDEERWLRVQVVLGSSESATPPGGHGDVLIHAVGAGEEISSAPDAPDAPDAPSGPGDGSPGDTQPGAGGSTEGDGLARTGAAGTAAALAGALLLVALGTALSGTAKRRRTH